jgi:hypothetical protein
LSREVIALGQAVAKRELGEDVTRVAWIWLDPVTQPASRMSIEALPGIPAQRREKPEVAPNGPPVFQKEENLMSLAFLRALTLSIAEYPGGT